MCRKLYSRDAYLVVSIALIEAVPAAAPLVRVVAAQSAVGAAAPQEPVDERDHAGGAALSGSGQQHTALVALPVVACMGRVDMQKHC